MDGTKSIQVENIAKNMDSLWVKSNNTKIFRSPDYILLTGFLCVMYIISYIISETHLVPVLLNLAPSRRPPAAPLYEYLYLFTLGSFNNALECAQALVL